MWGDVASAAVYLLPGFLAYEFIYRQIVPGRKQSELRTTVLSVIWSLGINQITEMIVRLRVSSETMVPWTDPSVITIQLAIALTTGLAAAAIERRFRVVARVLRVLGREVTDYPDAWEPFMASSDTDVVYVRLMDGSTYYGAVVSYSDQPDEEPKELLLTHAYFLRDDDAEPLRVRGPVYLRTTSIAAIEPAASREEAESELLDSVL